MTAAYAESSGVLAWLLGEPDGRRTRAALARADRVLASGLTSAEVHRTLHRLVATHALDAKTRDRIAAAYAAASAGWMFAAVDDATLARAGEAFPAEPVRTLDAMHLATAAAYALQVEPVVVVSLDDRLRRNALALGLRVAPDGA